MKYAKKPLSISQQVDKLENRGLIIDDRSAMEGYLSIISYYRFRAYTYPFQDNIHPEMDHHFIRNNIRFSDIIKLYYFDKKLRDLLFKTLGEIEVALRAKIIQVFSEHYGNSHWFLDNSIFNRKEIYGDEIRGLSSYEFLESEIKNEITRSNEDFIKHYKDKYGDPELPPAWMTLEVLSLGTLSRLYKLLFFDFMDIQTIKKTIKGDLLSSDAQALVNTVNTVGVMGKGITIEDPYIRFPYQIKNLMEFISMLVKINESGNPLQLHLITWNTVEHTPDSIDDFIQERRRCKGFTVTYIPQS